MDFDQNRAGPRKGSVALEKLGDLQFQNPHAPAWGFCYNTHSVRVRSLENTTFQIDSGRATTHLSGCVVASSFYQSPVVGAKLGGDAAAHPVFCLSNLTMPFHRCLLNGTPLVARWPATARRLQAGAPTSHSRPRSVVVYQRSRPLWTNLERLSFARIIPRKGRCTF